MVESTVRCVPLATLDELRTLRYMTETDVILVGAGPIGLEMGVALKGAGVDYVHLEAKQVGHTISWFPRQARFFSSPERIAICGVPCRTVDQSKATREEYLEYLLGIVQQFDLPVRTYERVTAIRHEPNDASRPFHIETRTAHGEQQYRANKVILTVGDMHGPRSLAYPELPEVPGHDLPHVSHYFDEPHPYFGQDLLIVGGRNSAVEAAIRCHRAGARVALSYRRAELDSSIKYWLKPEIEWLIKMDEIQFFPNSAPVRITPSSVSLAPVDAEQKLDLDPSDWQQVSADFVLLLIGYQMDSTLLRQAGVNLKGPNRAPELDPETMETNVPGLYIAGTAAAGTQIRFKLFIENCHTHVVRILRHICDQDPKFVNSLAYRRLHENPLIAES